MMDYVCDLQSRMEIVHSLTQQQQVASSHQMQICDKHCKWKLMCRGVLGMAVQTAMAQVLIPQASEQLEVALCSWEQAQKRCAGFFCLMPNKETQYNK